MKLTKELAELEDSKELMLKAEIYTSPAVINLIFYILTYWPLIKKALTIVKIFTGKKADEKIDKILEAGDKVIDIM